MRLMRLLAVVLALAALFCGTATAKNYAPPGRAGTSQYAEDIPSAGGNVSTPSMGGGNKTAAQISQIGSGRQGVHKLAKLGTSGAQAAQLAQATAPPTTSPSPASSATRTAGGRKPGEQLLVASGGSALSGVGHLLSGSDAGGIGVFLPVLLALNLVGALVLGFVRQRRPRRDHVSRP